MAVEDRLEQLNAILGTVNAGYDGHARMLAKQQLQEEAFIKKMARLNNETYESTKAKLDLLTKEIAAAKKKEQHEEQREKSIVEGIKKTINGLQQFAGGAVSASQSMYNSDNAFTAVIPTLNLLGDTVKNITSALSSFTSGIPYLGALFGAADAAVGVVIDLTTKVVTAQLENAQKMVNDYNAVSKAGMTFGADLTKLTEMSAKAGMSMSTFTKFVTNNIESLSSFGGGIERSAAQVGILAGRIATDNKALLTIYGGFEGLASATADYGSMLAGIGIDVTRSNKMSQKAVEDYLISQKELTAITGKSAATQKKEEEDRRKHAAYQIRMAALERTNADGAANVRRNISVFGAVSKEAADFATEVFNTQGKVTSNQALMFQSQYPELAATIRKTQDDAITQNAADFRKNQAAYLQDRAPLLKQEAEKFGSTFELSAGGVKNAMLDLRDSVSSGVIGSFSKLNDILQQVNIQEDNRKKLLEQNNIKDKDGKTVGPIVGQVIESLENFKIGMDDATAKSLPQIGQITKNLIGIQTALSTAFLDNPKIMDDMVTKFTGLIKDLLDKAGYGKPTSPGPRPGSATFDSNEGGAAFGNPQITNHANRIQENTTALENNTTQLRNNTPQSSGAPVSGPLTPAAQSTPALTTPSGSPVLKAPIKANAGTLNPETILALNAIYERFGAQGMEVTSGNDEFHKNRKSVHNTGRAADVKFRKGGANYTELETAVKQLLKEQGINAKVETHPDEDNRGRKDPTKRHMHIEVSEAQKKAEAADVENNSLLAQLVEIFEDVRDINMEQRDTLDILKRQMA